MQDKKGKTLRRGQTVRYNGELYKLLFAAIGKIIITGGDTRQVLNLRPECIRDRVLNIEIIEKTDYERV